METPLILDDLSACAFLVARGYEPLRWERRPGHRFRIAFVFPREAEVVADEFYQDTPIPARTFARALSDMKGTVRRAARSEERGRGQAYVDRTS